MEPAIVVDGLKKTYKTGVRRKTRTAVDGLNLEVATGQIQGLLGPNGAGKTTTLKSIMGFVRPTEGSIRIFGRDAKDSEVHRRIGFLPEQPYFYGYLNPRQTLSFYARLCGLDKTTTRRRILELLELVGLSDSAHMKLSKFSRGMLQRLGIAQALVSDPDLVILDEPASGLDPIGQKEMRNLVLELKGRGKTVLLSSHQLSEVEAICDSVSIIGSGTLRCEGTLDSLLNPSNAYSIVARGRAEGLGAELDGLADEVIEAGGRYTLAVPERHTYEVLDLLRRRGLELERVDRKRVSLEDYFIKLLEGERHER
ncbi:MAG: ABC transporter ATP-binding protein [Actinobacteria bacterium]|nr:MAG: ABC transporter ATP-binding protein [Actinomycetota bacterium]